MTTIGMHYDVIPGKEHPKLQEWKATLDLGTLFAAGVLN